MTRRTTVVVIVKAPVAGQVKTRLCPPCTPEEAAYLAEAALRDTLAAVAATPGISRAIALEGEPGEWLRPGFQVYRQRGDGLGERLANVVRDVGGPALVIAADTPQITPALLTGARGQLARTDAVLGPARDGGYWIIGLRRGDGTAFDGVPMSSPETGRRQVSRLRLLGYRVRLLPELRDVDDIDDALEVARAAPRTRFAAALASLTLPALESGTALLGER